MTEPQESQLIAASDLGISIGEKQLVSGVSLDVRAGECVALVGESGSGKSLTCRALLGTLHRIGASMTGKLFIEGRGMSSATEQDWRALRGKKVGFVPQASMAGLDPVMRVGQQLLETIRLHDGPGTNPKARALELLAQVEMPDPEQVYRSYPHQLSGGMRQRVMIALALAGRPKVLIADEPTTALDVTVERAILDLLSKLCREEQMGLLLVTHDLGVVRRSAQRVYVMRAGALVEHGETAEVLARPTVGLPEVSIDSRPVRLSGGQRQRIVIARALACEPEVLIADEPTSALDVSVQAQILNLLLDLRESRGLALVVVSHDLAVLRYLTETCLVMYRGEIIESGRTIDIFERPQREYTRELVHARR